MNGNENFSKCLRVVMLLGMLGLRPAGAAEPYRERLMGDDPVAYWTFDRQDECCFPSETHEAMYAKPGTGVTALTAGPRPPAFPEFPEENTAIDFTTKGAPAKDLMVHVPDPGARSVFDFAKGDTLTLEAWVQCRQTLRDGQEVCVVEKGANGKNEVGNWSLRLMGDGPGVRLRFAFGEAGGEGRGHRWVSRLRFPAGKDWHHVAVTIVFGQPESLRAWIDAKPSAGDWMDAGARDAAPAVNDADVWIGSWEGPQGPVPFPGCLDEVAIYRKALAEERIRLHAAREGAVLGLHEAGPYKPGAGATGSGEKSGGRK